MDNREYAIRHKLKTEFPHYAEKCLKIRAKDGRIIPFEMNGAQRYIHEALERQRAETGKVRAVILKGRQQGCSTYVQGRFYWKVTHGCGLRAFILTHLDDATRNLCQIVRRFHEHCPAPVRPRTSRASDRELVFDLLDSGYQAGTARSQGVGRSNTVQYFHGSEVAYWVNAAEHVSGVFQAVPDMPGTEVILESTAAGAGGMFHALCDAARAGDSEYRFVFVPWYWQDEYRKAPPLGFAATPEEEDFAARHGLDAAQVYWRRVKIGELGGEWLFRREYPSVPEDAFHADNPASLWKREMLDGNRVGRAQVPALRRVIVAVDPAVTAHKGSDETGIIVAGLGVDGHAYILADLSGRYTPDGWAAAVVQAFHAHEADRVIAEVNQGGEMVEFTLRTRDPRIPFKAVRASRGKVTRAEPVAALDAQGRVHHAGVFPVLEDQMCSFVPGGDGKSPDRADARVWAVTELMLGGPPPSGPKVWF